MDDLKGLTPGKIKKKNRRSQSESFMKLPDMGTNAGGLDFADDPDFWKPADKPTDKRNAAEWTDSLDELLRGPADAQNQPLSSDHGAARPDESAVPGESTAHRDDAGERKNGSSSLPAADISDAPRPEPASPLDLLDAPLTQTQQRDDIRRLTPSSRRRGAASQPQTPTAETASDAVESTIQKATRAADKTLDALSQLQIAIDRAERRHFFNSIGAYVLFCIILSVTLYFTLNSSAKAKYAFNAVNREQMEKVINAKKILDAEFEKDQRASSEAFEVFQLIENGRYEESIERYIKIRADLTHPAEAALLQQKVDSIRWKLADTAYHDGVILFKEDNLEQARDAFLKSLSYQENTAYTDTLHYYLAMTLYKLGDYEGARTYFARAMQGQLGADMDANARYYRAVASEIVGDEAEAYMLFDQFLKKYRYSKFADDATKRRARLERARPKD